MDRVVQIAFLILPFCFFSLGIIHKGHLLAFMLAAAVVIASQLKNAYLKLFVYYVVLCQVYMFVMGLRLAYTPAFLAHSARFVIYVIFAVVILLAVTKSKLRNASFYNVICISALLQTTLGIMQMWGWDPVYDLLSCWVLTMRLIDTWYEVVPGTMGNPNFHAAYLAICLPFFFRKHWYYCIPIIVAMIFSSNTFTAMVAACVGCIYYFKDKIKLRWIGLSLVPFLLWMVHQKQSWTIDFFSNPHDRLEFWGMALKKSFASIETFIFGCGAGAYWGKPFPLHNEWVDIFFRFGLIGFILIIGAVITLYRGNRILYSAMIIACVDAIGSYPFHLAPSLFLVLIIVGLMEREKEYVRSYSPAKNHRRQVPRYHKNSKNA